MPSEVEVFEGGEDRGYLGERGNWWFDPDFEHSYEIFDLDSFYQDDYFSDDHADASTREAYAQLSISSAEQVLSRPVSEVLELGSGGGWFTESFVERGTDITAVEGSESGYERTLERGIQSDNVIQHDLRRPLDLERTYDLVLCTEVAEHIEPPFSSQLVHNAVKHGGVIWFSFEEPGTNEDHYHHMNEQPKKFWANLFQFYGYKMFELPDRVVTQVDGRGEYLVVDEEIADEVADLQSLHFRSSKHGQGRRSGANLLHGIAEKVEPFIPPLLYNAIKRRLG